MQVRYLIAAFLLVSQTAFSENYVIRSAVDGKLHRMAFQSVASERRISAAAISPCLVMMASGEASQCEPDVEIHTSAIPNDSQFNRQWGLSGNYGVAAPDAWDLKTGSSSVVVAVIDTGVELSHPDLVNNLWTNPGEVAGNGIDDDGNGYIDDVHGVNFLAPETAPADDNGHGTHVSGIIGAQGNNSEGVSGVNWQVKILAAKALNNVGGGSLYDAISAVDYITDLKLNHGVNIAVINASWGMTYRSEILAEALDRAIGAGIMVAAAAGNFSQNSDQAPQYPAAYELEGLISVAATTDSGELANFSNYGPHSVEIAAPGVNIVSTYPGWTYLPLSGTSMATPFVSGALALLAAYDPNLSIAARRERLLTSGTKLTNLNGVINSGRLLNLSRLLRNETSPVETPPMPVTPVTTTDLSVIYFDDHWKAGTRQHAYLLGGAGERASIRVRSGVGRCPTRKLQFRDPLIDLVIRVPSRNMSGRLKFDLLNAQGHIVESHRVKLSSRSRRIRVADINRSGSHSFKKWCSEVRTASR